MKYWHKNSSDDTTGPGPWRWRSPYQRARSVDIEMTAYALLIYTRRRDVSGSMPIAKWLVSQRNSLGGFSSTQVSNNSFLWSWLCVLVFCFHHNLFLMMYWTICFVQYGTAAACCTDILLFVSSLFYIKVLIRFSVNCVINGSSILWSQDTVVALQALAEYAALTSGNNAQQQMTVEVTANTMTHSFTISQLNALVLQSVQVVPPLTRLCSLLSSLMWKDFSK